MTVSEKPKYRRRGGLGDIYFSDYEGSLLKLRRIKLQDMSSYVIQQMEQEVRDFNSRFALSCLERHYCVVGDNKGYYIVLKGSQEYMSLSEYLSQGRMFSLVNRLEIMNLVCRAMQRIQTAGPKHHGHLHAGNVLVNCIKK